MNKLFASLSGLKMYESKYCAMHVYTFSVCVYVACEQYYSYCPRFLFQTIPRKYIREFVVFVSTTEKSKCE